LNASSPAELASLGVDDLLAEQRAHPALEHEAVLVLSRVSVDWGNQGARSSSGAQIEPVKPGSHG
jgi:hypothetical protein